MSFIVDGTNGLTFPDTSSQVSAVQSYLITSASDIALSGSTIVGTNGQSGQSNVGSTFTMYIPTNGTIILAGVNLRATNDATATTHGISFGIRIGTTNYWFGYYSTTAPSYTYQNNVFAGSAASTVTDFYGASGAANGAYFTLDVAGNSIPTGSQTIQLITASNQTTSVTINGTQRQTRIKLLVTT